MPSAPFDFAAETIATRSLVDLDRRRLAALPLLAGLACLPVSLRAQGAAVAATAKALTLTPSQTEGPFYPLVVPRDADADLLRHGALDYRLGQPTALTGRVLDLEGRPMRGASVEIWQCDHAGHYDHPGDGGRIDPAFQGFGRSAVDAEGAYRFRTIRPVAYGGRTPHIHVKVKLGRRELLTTQLYVAGEPLNTRDFLWRRLAEDARAAITVPFNLPANASQGMMQAQFNLVVAA